MAPFRDDHSSFAVPTDPLARFVELHNALDSDRGWFGDRVPLRYCAVTMLSTPGDADAIANAIRECDAQFKSQLSWFSDVDSSIRMVLAAQLTK